MERVDLSDTSLRTCDLKDLVRKCLSEYKEWEGKLGTEKPTLTMEAGSFSNCHLSPSGLTALIKERREDAVLEKPGVKRGFELVDTSPSQEHSLVKKNNAEYTRGCKITKITPQKGTGLTTEICCLKLAGDGGLQETYRNGGQAKDDICTEQNRDRGSAAPLIAKNLMHDLNADGEKYEKKEHMNSSFLCIDDEKPLASMDSDLSLPEVSAAGSHLEKHLSDLDGSVKDFTFEELKTEDMLSTSSCCPDTSLPKGEGSKQPYNKQDKSLSGTTEAHADVHPSPSVEMQRTLNLFKKNVVAFCSYYSPINMSNISEPSRISTISMEGMDISACSGSYPMAITPAQKGRSYRVYQTPQGNADTPYRTPKSVRRGAAPVEGERILGTPDYLAPELLLAKSHGVQTSGPAVDWWALGVCLFEFLTGIPPFNDETPQQVFQNILKRDIPWPEGEEKLSANAQNSIDTLLTIESTKRAGLKELKRHPLFHGVDWDNLQNQTMPFIPQPNDETDTSYFEARNNAQHLTVSGFSL